MALQSQKGRNKKYCERYTSENREAKNKARKQARHTAKHPADTGQKGVPNYTRKSPLDVYEKLFSRKA